MKVLILPLLIFFINSTLSEQCYWNKQCKYKYFSSKTPYEYVRGDIRDSVVKLEDCEPVSIWALIRHGKRNPGTEPGKIRKEAVIIRDDIINSYEKGNSSLCAQDVENLSNWVLDTDLFDKPNFLIKEGYQEVKGIGRRLKQTFSKLLTKLEKKDYVLRHAYGMRMQESMKGFIEGLTNNEHMYFEGPSDEKAFDVLAPYSNCKKHVEDVKNNPETYQEADNYMKSSEYLAAKDRLRHRTGIDYQLTDANFTALYDLCRYTTSGIENKCSPWCALFTTEDLKAAEYVADLRHYYRSGYGTAINKLFGQLTLVDLLSSFQAAKDGNGKKITAYISHSSMMDMIYTALGLFKDEAPLTAAKRISDRKWRTSKIAVFSVNLMAVLNKCKAGDYNVVFYLNEEPLMSICQQGVCSWEEFKEKLTPFLNTDIRFCENIDIK